MDEKSDAALVGEACAGRIEAFAQLVRRYQDHAYGAAIGRLSDFDLARDVVQEAFLCAWRNLSRLREPSRFGSWLRGIVRNTAYRALREMSRVRALAEELRGAAEPFAPTPPPDRSAEDAERRRIVHRALQNLNEKSRETVSLHYVDGLSYAEIAAFLDVTEATVQGRLQRGRAKLRKELTMVEKTFKEEGLPDDFAAEIKRLLDAVAESGEERQRAVERLAEMGAPAIDPLCEALDDSRIAARRAAADALCAIGDARALRPILRLLYSRDLWRVENVFRSGRVLSIPGMREALLEHLSKGQRPGSWEAMHALRHLTDDDEVRESVLAAFRNTDPSQSSLRKDALWALCTIAPEEAVSLLSEALQSDNLQLRGSAAWFAVRDNHLPPVDDCLRAFEKGVHWWGRVCAANLVMKHGDAGRAKLEEVLKGGAPDERVTAALGLARTGSLAALHVLKQELVTVKHDRKWLKAVAGTVVRHYTKELRAWFESDRERLSEVPIVMWALARMRRDEDDIDIEPQYKSGSPTARAAALRMLSRRKGEAFLPELRRCLREGKPGKVASEAFRQMLRLGNVAVPTAEEMLTSEHWPERKAAVALLRRWGKLTDEQRTRAEADSHIAVRLAAT